VATKPKSRSKSRSKARAAARGNGHGGRRPGCGRPRERRGPAGVNWAQVRRWARLGGKRDTIVKALGFDQGQLREPAIVHRLQVEIDRGAAWHQLDLLAQAKRIGHGGKGSVNATLAGLREFDGWGRPDKRREETQPDLEAGIAELERVLGRWRNASR
jgi:hypothetical protein